MEVSARTITGADDGFTLWYVGLLRKLDGNRPRAALMAACTSRAALLMSRSRSNIKEMRVEPSVLRELISLRPAIDPSDCSSGVATLDEIGRASWRERGCKTVSVSVGAVTVKKKKDEKKT